MARRRRRELLGSLMIASGICLGAMVCLSPGAALGAGGGRYHVYSCRMPNGQAAPADGWVGETSPSKSAYDYAEDTCSQGGALVAALSDGTTHEVETDHATWTFTAPTGSLISAATLWRAGDADGGWATNATYEFWLAGPKNNDTNANVIDQCVAEFGCPTGVGSTTNAYASSNLVSVMPEYLNTHLYMNVSCGGSATFMCPSGKGDENGYAAVVYLYAADLVLEQTSSPTVGSVGGELETESTVKGTTSVQFEASDSGSGVYQAIVSVDGKAIGATTLDSNGGHCVDVGQTTDGLPAFLYLQPCELSASADVTLDTTQLSDGEHHVVVEVSNAAGNRTVVLDRKVSVLNHPPQTEESSSSSGGSSSGSSGSSSSGSSGSGSSGSGSSGSSGSGATSSSGSPSGSTSTAPTGAPNGAGATGAASLTADWGATAGTTIRSRYGRVQTIVGHLLGPNGAPIAGALIEASMTPSDQGAHTAALANVRTAPNGTFRLRVPARSPSSEVALSYRSTLGAPVPSASAALKLIVPASLTLHVAPRVSHAGGTIHFSGILRGGPIPPGGKQVVIQASSPHERWRTFEAVSTNRRGRYRASYRFRYPGPARYRFRAVSPAEADFPFAAGRSNVVGVRER